MAAGDLLTDQDVRDCPELGAAIADRADAAALVTAASRAIVRATNRRFDRADLVEALDGTGRDALLLSRPPIVAIASVSVSGVVLPADAYGADLDAGVLRLGSAVRHRCGTRPAWPAGFGNVVVSYTGGFDPIPEDVKLAALLTLGALIDSLGNSGGSLKSERLADWSCERFPDSGPIPPIALMLLDGYDLRRLR